MLVHEWSVMATDWMLATLCIVLAGRLCANTPVQRRSPRLVARAFQVCAACAFIGGIRHGLGPALAPWAYNSAWYAGYVLVALAGTFLLLGVVRSQVRLPHDRSTYATTCWLIGGLGSFMLLESGDTVWVALVWGADTVIIGLMGAHAAQRWSIALVGRWLLAGSVISVVAGLVQIGFVVGTVGTLHDDLFHILQMPSVWCYYRAALLFRETPDATS